MIIYSLCSGSKKNCFVFVSGSEAIIVDIGLPISNLLSELSKINNKLKINGLIITHGHHDHIACIAPFLNSKKFDCLVYCTKGTADIIAAKSNCDLERFSFIEYGKSYRPSNGNLLVMPIKSSHDITDPCNIIVWDLLENEKAVYATDTGKITPQLRAHINTADILLIESNHDVDMLINGDYPESLKKRVLSDTGHLSNKQCGEAITSAKTAHTFALCHLSEHNNTPELARESAIQFIPEEKRNNLFVTKQEETIIIKGNGE